MSDIKYDSLMSGRLPYTLSQTENFCSKQTGMKNSKQHELKGNLENITGTEGRGILPPVNNYVWNSDRLQACPIHKTIPESSVTTVVRRH